MIILNILEPKHYNFTGPLQIKEIVKKIFNIRRHMSTPRAFECYYLKIMLNWWHSPFKAPRQERQIREAMKRHKTWILWWKIKAMKQWRLTLANNCSNEAFNASTRRYISTLLVASCAWHWVSYILLHTVHEFENEEWKKLYYVCTYVQIYVKHSDMTAGIRQPGQDSQGRIARAG
jgi:hypothetical protein